MRVELTDAVFGYRRQPGVRGQDLQRAAHLGELPLRAGRYQSARKLATGRAVGLDHGADQSGRQAP